MVRPSAALTASRKKKFATIHDRLVRGVTEWSLRAWEIGTDLQTVAREHLFAAAGHKSFRAYVVSIGLSIGTANALRRVSVFARADVERYGYSKLDLVLRIWSRLEGHEDPAEVGRFLFPWRVEKLDRALFYISRTPADETPADVPHLRIPVAGKSGSGKSGKTAKPRTKSFAQATVADLGRAGAALRRGGSPDEDSPTSALPDEIASFLTRADRIVDEAVGKSGAATADVLIRRKTDAIFHVEVRGIPLPLARQVFAALAAAAPTSAAPAGRRP